MKIFPTSSIKKLDDYTIESENIQSIDLMERAAKTLTEAISERWGTDNPIVVFAGPGNNGGDALAIARMLSEKGYMVEVFLFNPKGVLSADCLINKELIEITPGVVFHEITNQFAPPQLTSKHLVIDGLFGSGLNKPLSGGFAAVVKHINAAASTVVSIDMPSGLMGEDNTFNIRTNIIRADVTLSIQLPKLAFLFAENEEFIGNWDLVDIGLSEKGIEELDTCYSIIELEDIQALVKPRSKFAHKGTFGHALLIAGSYGMAGAAVLAAKACLRSGVGLLTVHTPFINNAILQTAVPEAMVENDIHEREFAEATSIDDYQAVAIGPGLGQSGLTEIALLDQLNECQTPLVLDADALNILAKNRELINKLPKGSIITPHPKELERLVGKCQNSYERLSKAADLARVANIYVVLKGAYTVLITPESNYYFNPTGNPGMACGGSGDVLTGILLALMAQGYSSEDACKIGIFVHGLAGDCARKKLGEISMKSSDIINYLPMAFKLISE